MLGDDAAAVVNEGLGHLGLQSGAGPGVGVHDLHGHLGVHALGAQIEGGEAGDHLGKGIGAHIAQLGVADLLGLHAGGDAGQVAGLKDFGEIVVVVGVLGGGGLIAGGVAELNLRILLSQGDHKLLVAEAVAEDDLAAGLDALLDGGGAGGVLAHVALDHQLGVLVQAAGGKGLLHAHHVVVVVAVVVLLADHHQAHLQVGGGDAGGIAAALAVGLGGGRAGGGGGVGVTVGGVVAAGAKGQHHGRGQEQGEQFLLHSCVPPSKHAGFSLIPTYKKTAR